jgi:hypothetical protein
VLAKTLVIEQTIHVNVSLFSFSAQNLDDDRVASCNLVTKEWDMGSGVYQYPTALLKQTNVQSMEWPSFDMNMKIDSDFQFWHQSFNRPIRETESDMREM